MYFSHVYRHSDNIAMQTVVTRLLTATTYDGFSIRFSDIFQKRKNPNFVLNHIKTKMREKIKYHI